MTHAQKIALGILGAMLVAVFGVAYWQMDRAQPVACTMEAKLCPDGSYVGRTGPQCEFTACPSVEVPLDWKSTTDSEGGIMFWYPEALPATYIRALDWPPRVVSQDVLFTCTEAGSEIERAGRTESRMINGIHYCVTTISEGAAGSVYTQYAYAWGRGAETLMLTFSTRAPQCGNYPDDERTSCEAERVTFDLDATIGRIAGTVTFE